MYSQKNNISKIKDCFGCTVCGGVCPTNIIRISEKDGFLAPAIDSDEKCINCGICLKTCSFYNRIENFNHNELTGYSCFSKDQLSRLSCTSGGAVNELVKEALAEGYKIVGVRYNYSSNRPEHFVAESLEELESIKGSKYLQSNISDVVKQLKKSEKYVVIATPCQIASIHNFLKIRNRLDNVVLIDFFCHGVPSSKMWDKYLRYKERGIGKIKKIVFRPKDFGWQNSIRVKIEGNDKIALTSPPSSDIFFDFFLKDRCLSKACYDSCYFKQLNSYADIRVGDLWGKKFSKDKDGVSGLILFSAKGERLLKKCQSLNLRNEELDTILSGQMKKNARRSLSYSLVKICLRKDYDIRIINFMASCIEFLPDTFRKIQWKFRSLVEKKVL